MSAGNIKQFREQYSPQGARQAGAASLGSALPDRAGTVDSPLYNSEEPGLRLFFLGERPATRPRASILDARSPGT